MASPAPTVRPLMAHVAGKAAPDRLRKEKGEYAQRLRKAALHDSEGQAEHGAEETQYGVGGAHGGGPCQVLGL